MTVLSRRSGHSPRGVIRRLLSDRRIAFPAGFVLTLAISISNRRLCRVRHRIDFWEYRWSEGIFANFTKYPKLHITPEDPTGQCDVFFWDYQPKSNDIVLDVGAGLGEEVFALRTRVGPSGRVFGFEAHPATFAKLTLLCELNGWSNVEVFQAAIIDHSGPVCISNDDDYQTNNVFCPGAHEVEGIALDDFVVQRGILHVDYIKMNIEGAERLAILGMDELAKITDHICISCHDFLGTEWGRTSEQVRAWLESKGFSVLNRPNDRRPWVPFYMYASKTNPKTSDPGQS